MTTNYIAHCESLEDAELSARGNRLTAANYAELVLFYLVQQRLVEAKFCYYRASTKYADDILKEVWAIGRDLSGSKFGEALKKCKSLKVDEQFQPYVAELKKRLIALQLELVSKCYSSIEKKNLAALLGLVDGESKEISSADEANEIFTALLDDAKFGWSCDADGVYITPSRTAANFATTLASLVDEVAFGPIQRGPPGIDADAEKPTKAVATTGRPDGNSIEGLKALVACSDFFDTN